MTIKTLETVYPHHFNQIMILTHVPIFNSFYPLKSRIDGVLGYKLSYNHVLLNKNDEEIPSFSFTLIDTNQFGSSLLSMTNEDNIHRDIKNLKAQIEGSELYIKINVERDFYFKNTTQAHGDNRFYDYLSSNAYLNHSFLNIPKHMEIENDHTTSYNKDDFLSIKKEENIFPSLKFKLSEVENHSDSVFEHVEALINEDIQRFEKICALNNKLFVV